MDGSCDCKDKIVGYEKGNIVFGIGSFRRYSLRTDWREIEY
ncbi:hypothetical protein SPHINGO8BC_20039 [Sphingobacterium multivorum]|uniref:Uncharacterized protein n=1 Tax=Sphingobacterium multivorum TaxID=28454 RepID=A0A654BC98_SPHMU|nr:hypothetical protein SPHINGO8BC_20039 [Sphingobacterium multivorum]